MRGAAAPPSPHILFGKGPGCLLSLENQDIIWKMDNIYTEFKECGGRQPPPKILFGKGLAFLLSLDISGRGAAAPPIN